VSRLPYFGALLGLKLRICSLADSAKTALQTVAAGQAVENLLDFDDEPAPEGPTGLAATQVLQQPEAKNILSGTSANPLDDLVSIFGSTSLSPSAPIPSAAPATDPFGGLGGVPSPMPAPSTTLNQQEDLLGLF
jgi:AP-1 complex subunit beta-1